jgi:20S proteasome subunit alpha 6
LRALKETLSQDKELTVDNTSVGVVGVTNGKKESFKLYEGQDTAALLEVLEQSEQAGGEGESMEVDS